MPPHLFLRRLLARTLLALLPLAAGVAPCAAEPADAAAYPHKPIRLIVPFPPGGLADLIARPLAERLAQALGQSVLVENQGGASGTLGTANAAAAVPDGYTLLFTTANEVAVSPLLYKNLSYHPLRSFTPVGGVVEFAMVLVTGPQQTGGLPELTARIRRDPSQVGFAVAGIGTTNHLVAELYRQNEGLPPLVYVPYKGGGPAQVDVAGGHVPAMVATLPSALPLIAGGKLRPLAVSTPRRSPVLPDVPTFAEAGGKPLVAVTWAGVLGPAGLPPAVGGRLSAEIRRIVASPDFRERLAKVGAEPRFTTPQELAASIRSDNERWAAIIQRAGITPE
ncbi:Bug family tripartite tricarboxylate transporter substrate binding protein [Xylophilus sp.]|uniref:Bug family tripartite tricarboxylate transporter substrate binding protein n=1 Tax=Xylophilus sp. TaxID=2653893 RepID=UPI0013B6DF2F|nr:tripartite tricarboxylate transporter substrate binding protein [Xylophilus sp.]KAF1048726.1 MAG: hypothetical protein GAK38_01170 [Xylophilus sp.]